MNFGFSVRESVVGGSFVVAPIERLKFTGSDGNSDKTWAPDVPWLGNTYCAYVNINIVAEEKLTNNMGIPFQG